MPITKDGAGVIQYTAEQNRHNDGVAGGTGVHMASQFAVADDVDVLKQVAIDASSQVTNTTVTLKTQSVTPGTNVTLTLPSASGTLITSASAGISQLTGEVTAGPGTGSVAATVVGLGTGSNSFRLGPSASGTGNQQVILGASGAGSSGTNNVVVGWNSSASATGQDTVVGSNSSSGNGGGTCVVGAAQSAGAGSVMVGSNSTVQKNSIGIGRAMNLADSTTGQNIGIGNNIAIQGNSNNCVAIGYGITIPTGNANIVVFGESATNLNTYYYGQGLSAATTVAVTHANTPRTGADAAGSDAVYQPGNGTGSGGSGSFLVQTAPSAASSSTANTMATVFQVTKTGACTLGAASTTPTHVINSATNTAGVGVGTLTNAPSGGNPAGYLTVTINGTVSYIPFWQ